MKIWTTAIACSLAGAVMAGQIEQAAAAPLPTNVATMKAATGDDVTQIYWRGRGFGWGIGGLAAGAIIGGAIASSGPYGYYGGGPYYGGYGYGPGYGYAPAYYGGYGPGYAYGPGYGYRSYYRPRPYYGYRYGYYRPRAYYRPYYRGYW